jgi:hypothetical protein
MDMETVLPVYRHRGAISMGYRDLGRTFGPATR